METHGLENASEYLNNLLLARGLLRNGKAIDFAGLATAPDGVEDTMTRIINLIHDLVMRRDREAEQHETYATTIRSLRTTEAKQTLEIERLEVKVDELNRSLALTEGQERAFKSNIRAAESTIRTLKEQVQRMKSTVQQIRSQYATEIRKRDVEIQKLKTRLTERTRGKKDAPGVTTITIIPSPKPTLLKAKTSEGGEGLDAPGYSLRQETTDFLTQLCQSLSDENDDLIRLAQDSIRTLKELQGLTESVVNDCSQSVEVAELETDFLTGPVPPYETLSAEMTYVLDQLRALLTNPSFVSLEEVEIRDSEISRLRDGWEKMEERWKEAVAMMDNWHKRMAGGGDGVNIDELRLGIKLGSTIDRRLTSQGPEISTPKIEADSTSITEVVEPTVINHQALTHTTTSRKSVKFAEHQQKVLEESSGNKQPKRSTQACLSNEPLENVMSKDDDESGTVEKHNTISPRKRQIRKDTTLKAPPQGHRIMTRQATGAKSSPVKLGPTEQQNKPPRSKKRSSTSGDSNPRSRRRKSAFSAKELQKLSKIAD
ncbi:hypothetical protein LOZ12_003943 [Ophidiomyces ophidiicola]|uniref:Uncharacterized protein n=1 Tax=Ophidiomyces ophidiicola TaxID=1387563 RepID=A0ACB8V4F4_9EURO|nr:hypothetical protein LOZ62_001048 [Ophidiomyces ophidiicola]KAI1971919.1 hypothetical protein LOZ56_002766 [Ophidiomyces ophidiicola]KAI2009719.1 hypothetical protein LOZ50_001453 [Ophidiomyces ophidiicola]KAI2027402.1 hypothetical protein LOZ48_004782 [Ophidiomyces ophidiicola]KAI2035634.1 hypothetical protein LOZ47_004560 [Ophidiomyces ophidiicola]